MNKRDFEKIYSGRIPSKYLINRGLPGSFPCPYCGAEEDRAINDDQCCKCSVCGKYYLKVDPLKKDKDGRTFEEILMEDFGRDAAEEEFVTKDKIDKWRAKRTAKVEDKCISAPENREAGDFVVLPDNVDDSYAWDSDFGRDIKTIALSYGIKKLSTDFFKDCNCLGTIIFLPSAEGKYSFEANTIYVPRSVTIFGKNKTGSSFSCIIKGREENK